MKEESSLGRLALHKRVAAKSANQLAVVVDEATYCLTIGETPSPPASRLLSSWPHWAQYEYTRHSWRCSTD